MSKEIVIIDDPSQQAEMLIVGMKRIITGSPMDYEEIAKECLEKVGIDTKDPNNLKPV
jgi:hypothetical protein